MTASYTWDVFSTLDGFGSFAEGRRLGRLLGQARPRAARAPRRPLRHRAADGVRSHHLPGKRTDHVVRHRPPRARRVERPDDAHAGHGHLVHAAGHLGWSAATIVRGDAVDIVARLKQESDVPLRSPASLSLNWALMAAGLVDRLQ
jgi:hypothetical protein